MVERGCPLVAASTSLAEAIRRRSHRIPDLSHIPRFQSAIHLPDLQPLHPHPGRASPVAGSHGAGDSAAGAPRALDHAFGCRRALQLA